MRQGTTRVNPSEETIKIGPLGIRFLLTGDDSDGSVSVFEVLVPVGQKLAAPAHKNDAYEEVLYGVKGVLTWTVDGTPIAVVPGRPSASPKAQYMLRRGNRCCRRWSARPRKNDGGLPTSWYDVGAAAGCQVAGSPDWL
jgi:hypothetical protein